MTTQVKIKVRLVRCPKCLEVLRELPELSVYQCGGCGAMLQAKNRKPESSTTKLSPQEPDSAATSQQDRVLGQEKTRFSWSEDSPENAKASHDPLGQDPDEHQSNLVNENGERSVGPAFPDKLPSSGEITVEDESYPPDANARVENRVYQNGGGEFQQKGKNLVDEVQNLSEHDQECVLPERMQDDCVLPENDEKSRNYSGDQTGELDGGIKLFGLAPENGFEGSSTCSSSKEKNMSLSGGDSVLASARSLNGSHVSLYFTCDDEHLDHSQGEDARSLERVSSLDTLTSSHPVVLRSDFPANRSYYAFDGSESSYNGTNGQKRQHISRPSRKNNRRMDYRFRGRNMGNSEPERTCRETSSSHCAKKSSQWSQGTTTETDRYNSGHRMRPDRQGDISGYRILRTSGSQPNMLPPRPGVKLRYPSHSEPDRIDLLRTVCELKDQLNRLHFPKDALNRRFQDGKFAPFHYDHYKGCNERCNVSRPAFSGEAAHYKRHVGRYPQDWRYSEQLPSHSTRCGNGHCMDHNCFNISEHLLWGCETKPDNQRLDEMKRLRLRVARRHLRPVLGGAPFIACYHCSELLQLPADFLLFKRRCHRLMCNACKKILKFSVLRGTHIVPYIEDASAPPPSEADEYNYATRRINGEPPSQFSSS